MGEKTQFGVVVESIDHLLIVVFEWTSGDCCALVSVCVCVCSYCLLGDNGRLQYLRFCLLKCMLMFFFVIRCLYSAVSLTLVREWRSIRIIITI